MLAIVSLAGAVPAAAASLDRFSRLQGQDDRVARIAYQLSVANMPLCQNGSKPQSGLVLHGLGQYGPADRADAARAFGLSTQIGVMAVVANSPAQRAGLVPGDRLVSVNGRGFPDGPPLGEPGRREVDRAEALLLSEMQQGAVTLQVSGVGGDRNIHFTAERGCLAAVELVPGRQVNAWADGSRIMIDQGLLERCATDADLALVIGHEMAHNLLHHRQRLAALGVPSSALLPTDAVNSRQVRETEEEADRYAVRLAGAAGYDLSGAETFVSGLSHLGPTTESTHPAPARRLALFRAAIAAQRASTAGGARIAKTASSGLVSGKI